MEHTPFRGISADTLNLPQEVFDLLKDSMAISAVTTTVRKRNKALFIRTPNGFRQQNIPYLEHMTLPQTGATRDMAVNLLYNLVHSGLYEYQGKERDEFVFVRSERQYTSEFIEYLNTVIGNSPTFQPSSELRLSVTETGEKWIQGLDETQILRIAKKDKATGRWTYLNTGSFSEVEGMRIVPQGADIRTQAKFEAFPFITEEQFYTLSNHTRTFVNVDRDTEPCTAFADLAFFPNEDGSGRIDLEFLYNEKTDAEYAFRNYTAPRGWWSPIFRWEWVLYNEQPLPDHLFDGVNTMEDTAAAMSQIGNMGQVVQVHKAQNDPQGKTINYAPIAEGQVPHYNPETHTFFYDPTKQCTIEGRVRLLPLNGGKEATYEMYVNVATGEMDRY
jgi:hypothetical protein